MGTGTQTAADAHASVNATANSDAPPVEWTRVFDRRSVETVADVVPAPDGGLVFGGAVGADRHTVQSGYLTTLEPLGKGT